MSTNDIIELAKRTEDPSKLEEFSSHKAWRVRYTVAKNKYTDLPTLHLLTNDRNALVGYVAKNELKNRDVLGDLLGESRCFESFQEWRRSN